MAWFAEPLQIVEGVVVAWCDVVGFVAGSVAAGLVRRGCLAESVCSGFDLAFDVWPVCGEAFGSGGCVPAHVFSFGC